MKRLIEGLYLYSVTKKKNIAVIMFAVCLIVGLVSFSEVLNLSTWIYCEALISVLECFFPCSSTVKL